MPSDETTSRIEHRQKRIADAIATAVVGLALAGAGSGLSAWRELGVLDARVVAVAADLRRSQQECDQRSVRVDGVETYVRTLSERVLRNETARDVVDRAAVALGERVVENTGELTYCREAIARMQGESKVVDRRLEALEQQVKRLP